MKRTILREHIFKLIFMSGCYEESEMPDKVDLYLELLEEKADKKGAIYIRNKTAKILERRDEIDRQINEQSEGWNTDRMGRCELAILRLAVYEVLYDDDIPSSVAINEAVELAKRYGSSNAGSFVNGVLAKFARIAEDKSHE